MTETRPADVADSGRGQTPHHSPATLAGLDIYTMRARWAPALLSCLPLLALGALALPFLEDLEKLWSLVSVAVTTFAALAARKAGHRVQPRLYAAWGGKPTTARLRYSSATSTYEITRRHQQVERVLGGDLKLPTQDQESANPAAADIEYDAAMGRIVSMVRNHPDHRLANAENRNYGFARNLLGLKKLGLASAASGLVLTVIIGAALAVSRGLPDSLGFIVPLVASLAALVLWPLVDADYVRPSAEALADRVVEAIDKLPSALPRRQ